MSSDIAGLADTCWSFGIVSQDGAAAVVLLPKNSGAYMVGFGQRAWRERCQFCRVLVDTGPFGAGRVTNRTFGNVESLQHLNLQLRHQLEQAEAIIPEFNHAVEQLRSLRLLDDSILVGEIIQQGNYDEQYGPHTSGWLVQAAFGIGFGGLGTLTWDSEVYISFLQHGYMPRDAAAANFLPIEPLEESRPAIRALLLPQIPPFIYQIGRLAGVEI